MGWKCGGCRSLNGMVRRSRPRASASAWLLASVGVPVTFEGVTESTIEAHLLDFDQDIYGDALTLSFVRRLRPMVKFANTDELVAQIQQDIARTRQLP